MYCLNFGGRDLIYNTGMQFYRFVLYIYHNFGKIVYFNGFRKTPMVNKNVIFEARKNVSFILEWFQPLQLNFPLTIE